MNFITLLTAQNIDKIKEFYECLGLEFVLEKHNQGPVHFSCSFKDTLIEIYSQSDTQRDKTMFIVTVDNIEDSLKNILECGGKILETTHLSGKNKRAIIEDPDGRVIRIYCNS